jgi:hypothetical protein
MSGIPLSSLLPQIEDRLRPGEVVLFSNGLDAHTVVDGHAGSLNFRRWEMKKNDVGQAYWELIEDFVLGGVARSKLADILQREWSGCIFSEAATFFRNGDSCIEQDDRVDMATAKAWVVAKVKELLEAEEELSQALIIGPSSTAFELTPDTWNSDAHNWIDVSEPQEFT